jgi:TRAP-type C4-dicarboxylate transport system permease large subunit
MGFITQPVGIDVYVINGIAEGVPLETIFTGILTYFTQSMVEVGRK